MNDTKEPLQVADWSQPYKLAVCAIAILGLSAFIYFYFAVVPYAQEALALVIFNSFILHRL